MERKDESWIGLRRKAPRNKARLVVFPFAGGSASSFYRWVKDFPFADEVSLDIVELPGRGRRPTAPLIRDFADLNRQLLPHTASLVDDVPCIFLGYSMGAMIAFEQARLLGLETGRSPSAVILAARKSPAYNRTGIRRHKMSREKIVDDLKKLGGTPEQVIEQPELFSRYLDVLEADFQALESCTTPVDSAIDCPVVVIGGVDDPETNTQQLHDWSRFTRSSFNLHFLPGGHFFLHSSHNALIELVAKHVQKIVGYQLESERESIC